jgi:uncharacterized protein (DUF2235 family)
VPKNIVLCCENQSDPYSGNVIKLYQCLSRDENQTVFFYPAMSMRVAGQIPLVWTRWKELSFGAGLSDELRSAYLFLMANYEPGDNLFFFGAGRGAYVVRALAGILHLAGLLDRGNEMMVPHVISLASRLDNRTFVRARQLKSTFSRECPIHFVGIWDSPAKFGWVTNPFPLRMPFSINNPSIMIGRHALAIDERRTLFTPSLWEAQKEFGGPKDLKQVWFRGVHSDICGGYAEEESGLANISLGWMLQEAIRYGLNINAEAMRSVLFAEETNGGPKPKSILHNSLRYPFQLFEIIPAVVYDNAKGKWYWRVNLGRPRHIPLDSLIHNSVLERRDLPKNLPERFTIEETDPSLGERSL